MLKSLLIVCLAGLLPLFTGAQKLMKIVYVKDGIITGNAKEANMLIAFRSVNGLYERNDYTMNGPLRRVKTFKDTKQAVLEGNYLEYNKNGNLVMAGYYFDNEKSGTWYYYNDSGRIIKTEEFHGRGIFDDNTAAPKGDTLIMPYYRNGKNEWRSYIFNTLNEDAIARNQLKNEQVKISFLIAETGKIKDLILIKSEYFSFDNDVIKIISNAKGWNPASIGDKKVAYRLAQTVSMVDAF